MFGCYKRNKEYKLMVMSDTNIYKKGIIH